MRGTYSLSDGRDIVLRELRQWHTYEGVLEGRPSPEMNGRQLTSLAQRHQLENAGVSLFLGDIRVGLRSPEFPFGCPTRLPAVTCTARFESYSPTAKSNMMCSQLTLIWFQSEFWARPEFDAALSSIDWEADASDYDI